MKTSLRNIDSATIHRWARVPAWLREHGVMFWRRVRRAVPLIAGAGFAPLVQAGIVTIAKLGDPSPDGNGQLDGFERPSINNAGQVCFYTQNFNTLGDGADDNALYMRSVSGGPLVLIARAGQTPPGGNGVFSDFTSTGASNEILSLNSVGQFGFHVRLRGTSGDDLDDRAIYFGNGGPLAQVVRGGQPLPDGNGNFYRFDRSLMNGTGQMAVSATVEPTTGGTAKDTGIYISSSTGPAQKVVREGDPAPNGNGTYSTFDFGAFSDNGKLAFASTLLGATGYSRILSLGSGTAAPVILARQSDLVPDGGGRFSSFGPPAISSAGEVTFLADLTNTPLPLRDDSGIYRVPATGGGVELVVRENAPVPVGAGYHRSFGVHAMNNTGRIAFYGIIAADPNSTFQGGDTAYFLVSGGLPRRQVVRSSGSAPGGGTFMNFNSSMLALNNGGLVAFSGNFTGGGSGLFIGNGLELLPVIRTGQSLSGGTVTAATIIGNVPLSDHHRRAINDHGQVAFFASMTGGVQQGVFVFTPALNYTGPLPGSFDAAANWTLEIPPAFVHDVSFSPATTGLLTGPAANRTVKSLQVGSGAGSATFQLQPGATLTATDGLTLAANGVLAGEGTVAGNVSNGGLISPGPSPGLIHVTGNLTQLPAGRLQLEIGGSGAGSFDRLEVNQSLTFAGMLDVLLTNAFTPQSGQSFDLMNWNAVTGTFAAVNLPALPGGLSWDTADLYSTGTLRVTGGGMNGLQTWRQLHFGTSYNSGNAANDFDFDHDGLSNLVEYAFSLDPVTAGPLDLPASLAGPDFVLDFNQPLVIPCVRVGAEFSTSLTAGTWTPLTDLGTGTHHRFVLSAAAHPRAFLRVTVTELQ
jgi:hypothetical protein